MKYATKLYAVRRSLQISSYRHMLTTQACLRGEVVERLSKIGIRQLYLPQLTTTKPKGPHVPVLAPPLDVLRTRKRIVVIINGSLQDLGILAYRQLQRELGLNGGSVINFAKEMISRSGTTCSKASSSTDTTGNTFDDGASINNDGEPPGLVVMNPGQLLYSHKYNRPMTTRSWYVLPRKSIAHDAIRIHDQENYVPRNRTSFEHVKSVFDDLLFNPTCVAPGAELYIIAIEDGATNLLDLFTDDCKYYRLGWLRGE